ncbi:DUF4349 domain-containing protein [Streptomyces sp. NPDC059175]|uniref:DUF4349 domain-containing protein n=1 Tax=unclassified Streptomyces TaxID=2593676 RepID=UPI0036A3E76A
MGARRTVAAALLIASLALAGCSATEDVSASTAGDQRAQPAEADAKAGAPGSGDTAAKPPAGGAQRPVPTATHIIRTAELSVEVGDATKALASIRTTVDGAGGHVANESTERVDDTHVQTRVVLRVPQDHYSAVLAELAGAGRLLSRKADAKDVTDQVVDVESRIATQRASVARVRALMDRATQLSDIVTLEGELSNRQAALESLLAQQASLKDRTEMATITLELSEPERPVPADEGNGPGFLDALAGGWHALTAAVRWTGVVLGAVAPFAVVLAVLYAVWRWLVRPRLTGRAVPAPAVRSGAAPFPTSERD